MNPMTEAAEQLDAAELEAAAQEADEDEGDGDPDIISPEDNAWHVHLEEEQDAAAEALSNLSLH